MRLSLAQESVVKTLIKPRSKIPKQYHYLVDVEIPFPVEEFYVVPNKKNHIIHYSLHNFVRGERDMSTTPTIALHGLNGSRLLYQDLASVIDGYHKSLPLITMDFFGHGLSSCPDEKYNLDFFVEQIVVLLVHLGIGQDAPVNIIGFSLGGAVAVGFAAKYPERVDKLVLISPAGFVPVRDVSRKNPEFPAVPSEDERVMATAAGADTAAPTVGGIPHHVKLIKYVPSFILNPVAKYMFRSAFKEPPVMSPDLPDEMALENKNQMERLLWQSFVKKGTIEATMSIVKYFPLFDMMKEYTKIQASDVGKNRPVLLIWGDNDRINPSDLVSRKIKSFFQNSSLIVIPQAGHVVISEQPTAVITSVVDFLGTSDDQWFPNP
jgi:pimeloyl-ACP methyl ester carboxylesterase